MAMTITEKTTAAATTAAKRNEAARDMGQVGGARDTTFLDMCRERWSVRKFAPEQISPEHMGRIMEAGRNAPSACNYQPQRMLVLQSEAAISRVRAITHWAFNAPTVIIACADLGESWKGTDGVDSAEVDTAIALDHMMMEAWECGVGSTWVRGFDERVVRQAFGIPATWKVVAMMPMGYPAEDARPSGWHFRRKGAGELYRFL